MKATPVVRYIPGILLTSMLAVAVQAAQATTCDLSSSLDGSCTVSTDTSAGGAIYSNPSNSPVVGSGVINPFLTVQNSPTESGFSTDVASPDLPLDDKRTGSDQFTRTFSLSQLGAVVDNGVIYYQFFLDINEPDNNPDYYLSLDDLRIYDTKSSADVMLGKNDVSNLNDLNSQGWTQLYSLDNGANNNNILLNFDLIGSGSGKGYDMSLLIPMSVFAGVNASNRIVFANSFGLSGGSANGQTSADGFEEWASFTGETPGVCPPGTIGTPPDCRIPPEEIPEPGILSLIGLGLLGVGFTAFRRRT